MHKIVSILQPQGGLLKIRIQCPLKRGKITGAISDMADNCFTVWRNKKKENSLRLQALGETLTNDQRDKLKESDCLLSCDKQRNGDWEGKIGLWFDPASYQYLNHEKQRPIQYVRFSSPINSAWQDQEKINRH